MQFGPGTVILTLWACRTHPQKLGDGAWPDGFAQQSSRCGPTRLVFFERFVERSRNLILAIRRSLPNIRFLGSETHT